VFYQFLHVLARIIFMILGLKSKGLHNLPKKGPFIIAANHVSMWDPIVIAVVTPRPIHFMAKAEFFEKAWMAWFFRKINAFPVNRRVGDRTALRYAMALLEKQEVLGIFPEGFRDRSGALKAKTGTAMIAVKTGAPIVPVACVGTDRFIPFGWFRPLEVRIGKPIIMTEYVGQKVKSATLDAISEDIMNEVRTLLCK
jgi:1-acyl-sn-glycerol-3-phosphate acyltransferase